MPSAPPPSARAHASLTGSARSDNQAAIAGLLGTLDDATLRSRAAALPANDPLYNFAGRALIAWPAAAAPVRPRWRAQFDTSKRPPAMSDGYRPPGRWPCCCRSAAARPPPHSRCAMAC